MNRLELLNLDWVCVNYYVEQSPLMNGEPLHALNYYFEPQKYSARQFQYIYKVFDNLEEIAEITCKPFSHIIDSRLHQIKINNFYLYNGQGKHTLLMLKNILKAKFVSFNRVDICCDMVGFSLQSFMRQIHNDEIREKAPKKIAEYYKKYRDKETGKITTIYTGVSWGSKTSRWTAKIYDKIQEIKEESGKKYILDYFVANGIDIEKEKVWRYEFAITQVPKELHIMGELIKITDENIFDFETQVILLERYLNLHAFCYNTGKMRFEDEKEYKILQFTKNSPPKEIKKRTLVKGQKTAKTSINLNLQLLGGYLTNREAYICYRNILHIAREYNLEQWLREKHLEEMEKYYIQYSIEIMGVGNMLFTNLFKEEYKIIAKE